MSTIQVRDDNGVRVITFNRPDKRNALNLQMYTQLTEYLIQGESDNEIRAFMFRGQADCFTSGNDVADFLQNSGLGAEHPAFRFLFCLLDLQKPVVAAVTGAAVGIGTTMLLHCDLVYADQSAKFQLPFVQLALVPEAGASLLLPQVVGQAKASELLMLGESFNAVQAQSYGLINDVITSDTIFEYALSRAHQLAALPPISLQTTKKLVRYNKEEVRAQMNKELIEFGARLASDEAKARFAAFLKR
ncbi:MULTISPECIES: enoyl-CoA hydratase-related protein [unclassified Shewanella]|uniref:enoyl-CoA hydratase-related protein n=1 Tax=unclassified Shewanella TaxID=196818 RepID=UPI001BBA58BE|nr:MULTISPECIES: enoyl-CoA hydratase-related protein [unclassified Shewanella]GIU06272.1 enoyl-CoA hydratase [Shewanella sp. MBTL60-112-B1]GIU25228.1 enoyl-CoA hydratase [Shewanella sp. MBTL60-112-B2]